MSDDEPSTTEIAEMDTKEVRKQFPSGWMRVARYETVVLALDALLESPASREFTVSELAGEAGTSERSLADRIDSLVELGVVERTEGDGGPTYSLNDDSPIVDSLYDLNVTVQRVMEGDTKTDRESSGRFSKLSGHFSNVNNGGTDSSGKYTRLQVTD